MILRRSDYLDLQKKLMELVNELQRLQEENGKLSKLLNQALDLLDKQKRLLNQLL